MNHLQPKLLWTTLVTCFVFCVGSCQDRKFDPYNESDYTEIQRGKYQETDLYAIILQNKIDTQYTLIKMFSDSSYNKNFYVQHYQYKGLLEGPTQGFFFGKAGSKHFFKQGKRHGEEISLRDDSTIAQKSFYDMGKKVGIWEFYDSGGKLFKKKYFDNNKFVKQEIYSREGKLSRTEFEESTSY